MKYSLLFIIASILSCQLMLEDLPIDYVWHPQPIDTIPEIPIDTIPIDSVVVDSCDEFHVETSPAFVCFFKNKDVLPDPLVWYYEGHPVDLDSFFTVIGTGHTIYYSGQNIGGTVDGVHNAHSLYLKIYCRDHAAKHYLSFWSQAMYFRGALTFLQYYHELETHPSARLISTANTAFTCDEYIQILEFVLADCKAAPDNGVIDLRFLPPGCTIPQEIIDELIARGWNVWM